MFIQDIAMRPFEDITYKPMQGALLILKKKIEFGIIKGNTLYLFADDRNIDYYTHARSEQYSFYKKSGKETKLEYWAVPDEIVARPRDLGQWVGDSVQAATRKLKKYAKRQDAQQQS
jgi:TfoX/Sxy family transcriptional regulator of competence genes